MDAEWIAMVERLKNPKHTTNIAIVGKYTTGNDAYISVQEAIKHGGIANEAEVHIEWIEAEMLTDHPNIDELFENIDGILVPGGFGDRGIEGMITADQTHPCLLYTSPSPRDRTRSRMPSSA